MKKIIMMTLALAIGASSVTTVKATVSSMAVFNAVKNKFNKAFTTLQENKKAKKANVFGGLTGNDFKAALFFNQFPLVNKFLSNVGPNGPSGKFENTVKDYVISQNVLNNGLLTPAELSAVKEEAREAKDATKAAKAAPKPADEKK